MASSNGFVRHFALLVTILACSLKATVGSVHANVPPSSKSFIIPVYHQAAGQQPYPRSAQSKAMSISLGSGPNKVSYNFTIDTGSGVLLATCRTPASMANCNNSLPAQSNYLLTPAATVSDAATCSNTGFGCLLTLNDENNTTACLLSEQLTGGDSIFNVNTGIMARDSISFDKATALTTTAQHTASGLTISHITRTPGPFGFNGLFGCAEAFQRCNATADPDCTTSVSTCPAEGPAPSSMFEGDCPGSNNGIEAGWTFNVGGPASALGVPEQAFRAGLISRRVTGMCYMRPQKDGNCRASLAPNSYVVLGPALPRAITTRSRLFHAPLIAATFPANVQPGQAIPQTHTFRSNVASASVPTFSNDSESSEPWTSSNFSGVSILWDTGAYGQSTVATPVHDAFARYFEAAWSAVNTTRQMRHYKFSIERCPSVSAVCGDNIYASALHSCLQISLPANASLATRAAAKQVLQSLYPSAISITAEGGSLVNLPAAFVLNLCSGQGLRDTTGVAVCSYLQAPPAPSAPGQQAEEYFWFAGPWFTGRFVQFDASGPMPGYPSSTGTVYWSNTIDSCLF